MPRLENWMIIIQDIKPYQSPELARAYMIGEIYNDNRFEDGKTIRTSTLVEFDIKNNTAETENTIYTLGNPSEEWKKWLEENNNPLSLII